MGTMTYTPIATTTLSSAASSITFSSISGSYTDLRLVLVGTGDTGGSNVNVRFNSDSATNYSNTKLVGEGTSASSARNTSVSNIFMTAGSAVGLSTTVPHIYTLNIFSYVGSTYKTTLFNCSEDNNGSGSTVSGVGLWRSTSAITTVAIFPNSGNWNTGTTATLYGIKAA